MKLGGVLHRLSAVEREVRRQPAARTVAEDAVDLAFGSLAELRSLHQLLAAIEAAPPGEADPEQVARAHEITATIHGRCQRGELPPGREEDWRVAVAEGREGSMSAVEARSFRRAQREERKRPPGLGDRAAFEARRRTGELTESRDDGTAVMHLAPGAGLEIGFDPAAAPEGLEEDAAVTRPAVGLAARAEARAETVDREPESVARAEPSERRPARRPRPVVRTPKWFDPPEGIEARVF